MKIVIVSFAYAPDLSPRAFRWATIAEYWCAQGHDISVVCGPNQSAHATTCRNGVKIYRLGYGNLRKLRRRFGGDSGGGGARNDDISTSRWRGWRRVAIGLLRYLYSRTWRLVYWPDYAGLWCLQARRRALELCVDADGLITVSPAFSAHVVGLMCRRARPEINWIADFGDPFSQSGGGEPPNNTMLYGRLNLWAERRVLADANGVSFTTAETISLYRNLFGKEAVGRCVVIPPVVPSVSGSVRFSGSTTISDEENVIRIAYFGRFYSGIREPKGMLCLFGELARRLRETGLKPELYIVGQLGRFEMEIVSAADGAPQIHILGEVSLEKARQLMQRVDILLNIGNNTSYQLPSKLVEYVASGKPIINLCSSTRDSSALYLASYSLAYSISLDVSFDEKELQDLCDFISRSKGKVASEGFLSNFLAPHSPAAVAEKYENLLASGRAGSA